MLVSKTIDASFRFRVHILSQNNMTRKLEVKEIYELAQWNSTLQDKACKPGIILSVKLTFNI